MFRTVRIPVDEQVSITIDGVLQPARQGESVASVILRDTEAWTQIHAVERDRRAPYCMMGVCFECLVTIDGVQGVRSCMREVSEGMTVRRQRGRKDLSP